MSAITISGLTKTYKGKKSVEALRNLHLDIFPGEILGFLGPNGAGKSTTIKTLMGLIRPTAGNAQIMGKDISSHESRRKVGYLPENPSFYDYLSAEEYLHFVGKAFGLSGVALSEKSEYVLKLLELWDARKRQIRGYSKGMVQRVGLAQALIHDPELYVLDEPMSGLDPVGRALVKEIILGLKKRGKTVFFSTHITDDVEKVCDRVAVLVKGDLVALDSVDNILKSGVEGYQVQLRMKNDPIEFGQSHLTSENGPLKDYYIPKEHFNGFLSQVVKVDAEIVFIETKRRNLEDFFLSLVGNNN